MSAPRFTTDQKNEIVALYVAGEKIETIAAQMGCDKSYPRHLAKRRGVSDLRTAPVGNISTTQVPA